MNYRHVAFAAAFICSAFAAPASAGEPRAVIELFTSQGCSSCPAADRLLGELSQDSSLMTMSLPVDYWDYLGWKDTLALHGHTLRQRAYSVVRGDREVYTPQVVVNGLVHVLGSDKAAIENAIKRTRHDSAPLTVPVTLTVADGEVTVNIAAGDADDGNGEVWLCPVTVTVPVKIGRGENRDRTVVYHNVVRRWVKLGDWTGKAASFSYKLSELPNDGFTLQDIDRLDVIVQKGNASKPGMMLGAATAHLP